MLRQRRVASASHTRPQISRPEARRTRDLRSHSPTIAAMRFSALLGLGLVVSSCANSGGGDPDLPPRPTDGCQQAEVSCNELDDDCDGRLDEDLDLMTDPNNCGECGVKCEVANGVLECVGGECGGDSTCEAGYGDCDQ